MIPAILLWFATSAAAAPQNLPAGEIIPDVQCAANPSQTYALYLPRQYSVDRPWPLILAFDPGGRGTNPVERYRAAADEYGFIVAGSNNSRNRVDNDPAVVTMANDVLARFRIDSKRVYMAGM